MEDLVYVKASNGNYPIYIRKDFSDLSLCLHQIRNYKRIAVISDSNVAPLYLNEVKKALSDNCENCCSYVFPAGEENKQLKVIEDIYEYLIGQSFDRKDLLVALGGGVAGDMTGFAAATYLRGIDFVQVPTTLLSQVDSSIGGKTGVDFRNYKNMVGAFKQPVMVYINTSVLRSLPDRQFSSGMAEIIKHGCIRDRQYLTFLESGRQAILAQDPEALREMIYTSLIIKGTVVEEDPTEKGVRAILNFGHTLGHALEKETCFSLTHGEGVALGCVCALFISQKRTIVSAAEQQWVEDLLKSFGLPVRFSDFDTERVLESCHHDKKMDGGKIRFILLKQLGNAESTMSVTWDEMREALQYIKG